RIYSYNIAAFLSAEDLEKLVRARRWEVWSSPKSRFIPRSFEMTRDSTIAPLAMRFHFQLEDQKVKGTKRRPFIYETSGLMLVHPDSPHLLVSLEYSEW